MPTSSSLVWIRRDLRIDDHLPLTLATKAGPTAVVFVFDTNILDLLEDRDDRRVTFISDSLRDVDQALRDHGSRLIIRHGDPVREIVNVAKDLGVHTVYAGRDYEPSTKKRDEAVERELEGVGVRFVRVKDQVIFDRGEVLTGSGTPFKVFTPYHRAWLGRMTDVTELPADIRHEPDLERLIPRARLANLSIELSLEKIGFRRSDLWLRPGTSGAVGRLTQFMNEIGAYGTQRNIPSVEGTSGLSVHLRFGTISPREALRRARRIGNDGARTWIGELAWRDFFHMILDHFPFVVERTFRPEFNDIRWTGSPDWYDAWKEGMTGFPIVDAAMRHFKRTGWMHNRLRMIVASFLVKDLLVDWRLGEAWFARNLLDFDLALNNGNWQWAASTGVDAQPYFRIFNPVEQSKRFDPEGLFVRRHLPELAGFSNRDIHFPSSTSMDVQSKVGCVIGRDYPAPIVDHAVQRQRALELYASFQRKGR